MLEALDYAELTIYAPSTEGTQWLGAHAKCLNRLFDHTKVQVAGDPSA